jgi:hypothetical protein
MPWKAPSSDEVILLTAPTTGASAFEIAMIWFLFRSMAVVSASIAPLLVISLRKLSNASATGVRPLMKVASMVSEACCMWP